MMNGSTRNYAVAVDVGGTCTDCVVYGAGEAVRVAKAFSTPPDFANGVIDSVRIAAKDMSLRLEDLLANTKLFLHGSTVVDNTIITRDGARTGLITTAGFEDTLIVTRGAYGRWSGQSEDVIKHPVMTKRPEPLTPRTRIFGVRERIDSKGAIVLSLDDDDVRTAIDRLVNEHGVEAIAVCLLWSFRNSVHERKIREIIHCMAPRVHVSISSEVAPVPGEYERTSTTVINAYAGSVAQLYLDELSSMLSRAGYGGPLLVMQGYGGLVPVEEAATRPVGMIECGPAAGVVGSQFFSRLFGERNVIAADMGGTTFKVGVIQDGEFGYAREPIVDRLHYVATKIDVASIGAGGGSIVSVDARTRRPLIGPRSAGARPGPICYGRGGEEPTLTDVAAIIGYMDPGTFLGGAIRLDLNKATSIFAEKVARPLGMEAEEAAIGVYRVAAAQIADLIREVTIERGLDPRDFDIHSFGGSCSLFAGSFAKDLAVKRVVVPFTASVNCAFGMIAADVVHEYSRVEPMLMPFDAGTLNAIFEPMARDAAAKLAIEGFASDKITLNCAVELRYRRQVHQIVTPLHGAPPFARFALDAVMADFEQLYERRYGRGSAFRGAGMEAVIFRLKASGLVEAPTPTPEPLRAPDPSAAEMGRRNIYVDTANAMAPATIYDYLRMCPGNRVRGPAVIHTPITTIVIQSQQIGRMDQFRNLIVESER
jgi:N-methylhydantoinase A